MPYTSIMLLLKLQIKQNIFQSCLERQKEGVQTLHSICHATRPVSRKISLEDSDSEPKVFISYQWDVQDKVCIVILSINSLSNKFAKGLAGNGRY